MGKTTQGKDRDGRYVPPKGKPSGEGQPKAGPKPVLNIDNLDERNQIADTYTDGPDDPASNVREMNPNRNTNKEDIDKPSYGGGH